MFASIPPKAKIAAALQQRAGCDCAPGHVICSVREVRPSMLFQGSLLRALLTICRTAQEEFAAAILLLTESKSCSIVSLELSASRLSSEPQL